MLLFRKKMILAKLESSYGVDPTPTGSANSILTKELAINTFQGNTVDLNYDKPYIGNDKSLYTAPYTTLSFNVDLAGAGTAGVAPAYGALLRACGMEEIVNATAVTGTAQAGASTTITLHVGASASDDAYNDLLITLTGGTGSGQTRRITDYNGTTKVATVYPAWTTPPDATSTFSIDAQVVYAPVSDGFESVYFYFYLDGVLHKAAGSRGSVSYQLAREALPMLQFNFTAQRVAAAADANPTANFAPFIEPLPVNNANTPELLVHGYATCTESISADVANSVVYRNVINCDNVLITDRAPTMNVAIEHPAIGDKNYDAIIAAHTAGEVYVVHGTQAGGIVRIDMPRVQLTNPQVSDSDGIAVLTMDGRVLPSDTGNDELFLTVK